MKRDLGKLLAVALLLTTVFAFGGDKKKRSDDDASANLSFTVTKDSNGKPVKYAAVILHSVDKDGKQSKGGLQLKTNEEGVCSAPGIPFGKMRIQVIAKGFQTYGEDIEVQKPDVEVAIKLKGPTDQYTIYK
jgi:hypothetical protein